MSRPEDLAAARLTRLVVLGAALLLTLHELSRSADLTLVYAANVLTASCAVALVTVFLAQARSTAGFSFLYLLALSVFHAGLTMLLGLGLDPDPSNRAAVDEWLRTTFTTEACLLAAVGVVATALGIVLVTAPREEPTADPDRALSYAWVGSLLMLTGVSAWIGLSVLAGGPGVFLQSKTAFLSATSGQGLPNVYFLISLAAALLAAGAPGPARMIGLLAFGVFAPLAFAVGLRGEVLFPLLTATAVLGPTRVRIGTFRLVALLAAALALVSVLADLRQVGLQARETAEVTVSPLAGLAELGGSLRPVAETVRWTEDEGFLLGGSYVAPLERYAARLALVDEPPPAAADPRTSYIVAQRRVGAIGYSPIAEAWRNFGTSGVVGVMAALGAVLGMLDRGARSVRAVALAGAVFTPLLIGVRNDFTATPAQVVVGVLLVATVPVVRLSGRTRPGPVPVRARAAAAA